MKNNTYSLLRHFWNDVSEDWPFYTDYERQCFRRRKPQNLTPPFSDGSTSSSGHSPSSTHPASPPSLTTSSKRPSSMALDSTCSSPAAKRKRVSKYVRPLDMQRYAASRIDGSSPAWSSPPSKECAGDLFQPEECNLERENDLIASSQTVGKILSKEERTRYKQEFNRHYKTYCDLHEQLGLVSKRFTELEEQLKNETPGSRTWKVSHTKGNMRTWA